MGWLRDYGAFIAATVAAVASIANSLLSARRQSDSKREEWQRELRAPTYSAFLQAARQRSEAILWTHGDWDPEILGPAPKDIRADQAEAEFAHRYAEVLLVGPPAVSTAARTVSYSLNRYQQQLEEDPFGWGQSHIWDARQQFTLAAQGALGLEEGLPAGPDYQEWLKANPTPAMESRGQRDASP